MEDILASIRRILNEDDASAPAADGSAEPAPTHLPEAGHETGEGEDEVLVLDPSMIVIHAAEPVASPADLEPTPAAPAIPLAPAALPSYPPEPHAMPFPAASLGGTRDASDLLAPESEAAAVSSVGSLLRLLTNERATQVHRGGPTIEDLVREEIRPLLKGWLDQHLPPMVERLVRIEIERVTGRAGQ